jgi:arylsulfatase A-like enzyme
LEELPLRWSVIFVFLIQLALHAGEKPNVLFIAIDDQNDWLGCMGGHPQVKTPHIDALAARGTLFLNAHCQSPLCNPSRASLMTSRRPSSTGIYGLAPGLRQVEATRDAVTLSQAFTSAGYFSATAGKIFHDGSVKKDLSEFKEHGPAFGQTQPSERVAKLPGKPVKPMDWGVFNVNDEDCSDYKIASAAISFLEKAPANDLYPADKLVLPPVKENDRDDTPRFSWYMHWSLPEPRLKTLRDHGEWEKLVRAYLASTSFMDAQVGRVLEALDKSGRAQNTVVVLWSDHGWHLGEKLITGKNTLWDRSTRVPLIFAGPGVTANARCTRPAELLDIYPTLMELCTLPKPDGLEGLSLLPQLKDATAPRERPAITTHNQNNHGIRSEDWRYIRYADGSEELYDMKNDPNEWNNRAADPALSEVKKNLAKWLPTKNEPPAPGSKHRILTYNSETKETVWEEKAIGANDPIPDDQ